jgi:hypothetical protein
MTMIPPISFRYDGSMVPSHQSVADRYFVYGQRYVLIEHQVRSRASHDHFFASVDEAWANLPEQFEGRWPTADHLRKWCLIHCGYRDERTLVASSKAEALRLASFVKPMDEFAVVHVMDAVVTVYTAKSQSMRAMGKSDFQRSKTDVLAMLADMLGTTTRALISAEAA